MANPNEKEPEFPHGSQWEPEQKKVEPELEHDLIVLADIMKGVVMEKRRVKDIRLVKIMAKEGEDLFHNGFKLSAKTVLVMIQDKSEPELLAGEYAHTINDSTLNVMFTCIDSAEQFRKFSDELFAASAKLKDPNYKFQEGKTKIVEAPKVQATQEIRGDLENVIKPRF